MWLIGGVLIIAWAMAINIWRRSRHLMTVLGMLVTFRVIQGHGTSQPSMLAEGIRQALLTTQSGLWAALPVLLFHERISSQMRKATSMAELVFHKLETVRKNRQIK